MGLSTQDILNAKQFIAVISKFKAVQDRCKQKGNEDFADNIDHLTNEGNLKYMDDVVNETMGSNNSLDHTSGLKENIIGQDYEKYDNVKEFLQTGLDVANDLLKDEELMRKEPMLKSYIGFFKSTLDRSFSDSVHANDHYEDTITGVTTGLFNLFDEIPTQQEIDGYDLKNREIAADIKGLFDSYSNYYDYQMKYEKALDKEPSKVNINKYFDNELENANSLAGSAEEMGRHETRDVALFYTNIGRGASLENPDESILSKTKITLNDAKINLNASVNQIDSRINLEGKHLTGEDERILDAFVTQIGSISKDASGNGVEIDHLPESFREPAKTIDDLAKKCKDKLVNGFDSFDEKAEFFKELGQNVREALIDLDFAYKSLDKENLTPKETEALNDISSLMSQNGQIENGAIQKAQKAGERYESFRLASDKNFKEQFESYYEMMKNTGSGYLLHKNTKEYNNMMKSAEAVSKLNKKESLNEKEMKLYTDCMEKLKKDTMNYLSEKKMENKKTEVGEDRFAGAMGILNLIDPINGEGKLRHASQIRGRHISLDDIKKRADEKQAERNRKAPEKAKNEKTAKKTNAKNTEKKNPDKLNTGMMIK